ncbi:hypothetical protein Rcae01_02960 [Novipirellula caenicola]|uniref:Uncharacterized protein n=1 Tax=Novipirellula caenicola TaxID=1536901 RepID=A0ABP9VQP9_9BACT
MRCIIIRQIGSFETYLRHAVNDLRHFPGLGETPHLISALPQAHFTEVLCMVSLESAGVPTLRRRLQENMMGSKALCAYSLANINVSHRNELKPPSRLLRRLRLRRPREREPSRSPSRIFITAC